MAGLLDWIGTPEGQGLLAGAFGGLASARKGTPINNIGKAGVAGLLGYGSAQDRISQEAQLAETNKFRSMQTAALQDQINGRQSEAAEKQRIKDAISNFGRSPLGAGPTGMVNSALPADLQIGAMPALAQPELDYSSLIRQGVPESLVKALAESRDYGRQEVARTVDVEGAGGVKQVQGFDKFGRVVGAPVNGYVAPVSVNQGDRTTFVKPAAGVSLPMNMSFADRNAAANLGIAQQRLSMEKTKAAADSANGGYSAKPLPAAALKMQNDAVDAIGTAANIDSMLSDVEKQIAGGKVSFGPVSNLKNAALNAAGISTEESRNFSSFKSNLEKLRNESLRLNSGVQTDGDAQRAWNEMFQNINDTELVKQRLGEIRGLNKRAGELQRLKVDGIRSNYNAAPLDYSKFESRGGASGSFDGPQKGGEKAPEAKPMAFDSKPPAQQYKGKSMTGPDGKRYQSDGMMWKEVK